MKLTALIKNIDVLFPKPPVHTEEERKARERKIVARYAQGNISLHLGKYLTKKEIEDRKTKLFLYRFLPKD